MKEWRKIVMKRELEQRKKKAFAVDSTCFTCSTQVDPVLKRGIKIFDCEEIFGKGKEIKNLKYAWAWRCPFCNELMNYSERDINTIKKVNGRKSIVLE